MKRAGRIIDSVSNVLGYFSGWLVALMMLLIFFEVFMRYVLNRAPCVADEMSAYMWIALIYIGLAYAWREKGHVRIEFVVNFLYYLSRSLFG